MSASPVHETPAVTLTPEQLTALVTFAVKTALAETNAAAVPSAQLPDNQIAADGSSPKDEPMYLWIAPTPVKHHTRFRVWFRGDDGKKKYETFTDLAGAEEWAAKARKRVLAPGGRHPIGRLVEGYLETRTEIKPQSKAQLRAFFSMLIRERNEAPIEIFPWVKAWEEGPAKMAVDTQHGVQGAFKLLLVYCRKAGVFRDAPELPAILGHRRRGKKQLRIDECRRLVATCLNEGDPLAIAIATALLTGLRVGELMALEVRDCDDGASILWVERGKTQRAKRAVEVPPFLRGHLGALTADRPSSAPLFPYEGYGSPDLRLRTDAIRRRLQTLCKAADVPRVTPHGLRGTHATIAAGAGATGHLVAAQLGHASQKVTELHYFAPGSLDAAAASRTAQKLIPAPSGTS